MLNIPIFPRIERRRVLIFLKKECSKERSELNINIHRPAKDIGKMFFFSLYFLIHTYTPAHGMLL